MAGNRKREPNERISVDGLAPLYHEPEEVREQLRRLFGLSEEPFCEGIGPAWLEWAASTEFDAPAAPGTLLWLHTVRHERRLLVQAGWRKDNSGGFSSSISPNGRMAIAVETGDKLTGTTIYGKAPRTNSMKGHRLMEMLRDNRATIDQGDFFTGYAGPTALRDEVPLLWIHLIHENCGDVLHEISLPLVANEHRRIVGWQTRIILPRWRGGADGLLARLPAEPTDEPAVRVVRRVG